MAHTSRARFTLATVLALVGVSAAVLIGVDRNSISLPAMLTVVGAAGSFAVPAPAVDEPAPASGTETAVFAGGCFWGVEGVFEHLKGVTSAVAGYAGGTSGGPPSYEEVSSGETGHAESVQVIYDPAKITYRPSSSRSSSPWRTTPPSSTARVPTRAPSTARRFCTRRRATAAGRAGLRR